MKKDATYIIIPVVLAFLTGAGCASVPAGSPVSAEQQITVDKGFDTVWQTSINILLDQKFDVDLRDYPPPAKTGSARQGRIEAVKPTGKSFLKKYRQRLVIVPVTAPDGTSTVVAAKVVAETFSVGLLTEAAWRREGRPDTSLSDTFLTDLGSALGVQDGLKGIVNK